MEEDNEENQAVSNPACMQSVIERFNLNPGFMSTPLLIQNLGHLLTYAQTDFPIQADNQAFEFKHLRHPDSYQASVVQLCHLTGNAFSIAESSMLMISLQFPSVTDHIQSIQEIFEKGEPEDVEDVPDLLKRIDNAAKKADEGMENTYDNLKQSYDLINELLESLVAKKGNVQANLDELQKQMDQIKKEACRMENVDTELQEQLGSNQEELENATKKHEKAKSDQKFWNNAKFVAVPITAGLAGLGSTLTAVSAIPARVSAAATPLASALVVGLKSYAENESEDIVKEVNDAQRLTEHFQNLVQMNLEDIRENG